MGLIRADLPASVEMCHNSIRFLSLSLDPQRIYSLACRAVELRAWSLKILRRIFPDALLGISSINTTPPRSCLWRAMLDLTYSFNSASDTRLPDLSTTYARGSSLPGASGSGVPITATSATLSCVRRSPSTSTGETCSPLYLMSS